MGKETEIYIRVSAGAGESWRTVRAVCTDGDLYRILDGDAPAGGETWQFAPGDTVRCKPYELTDHDVVLVACEKV